MSDLSKTEQLSSLVTASIISAEQQEKAIKLLTTEQQPHTPWFVHVLQGFGAWLSAVMFIIVFALMKVLDDSADFVVSGGLLLVIALILNFKITDRSSYLSQLLFAMSLTGHVLLSVGIGIMMKDMAIAAIIMGLVSVIFILFYSYGVHKFLSVHFLFIALLILAYEMNIQELSITTLMFITILFTCWMWLNESRYISSQYHTVFRPIQYALVSTLLMGAVIIDHFYHTFSYQWDTLLLFPLHEIIAVGFFFSFAWLIRSIFQRLEHDWRRPLGFGLLGLMLMLSVTFYYSPSVLAALLVLLLGIERHNRILIPLAIFSLIYAIGRYYYQLDLTLLHKSLLLMGSGLILLVAGVMTYRQGRHDHA